MTVEVAVETAVAVDVDVAVEVRVGVDVLVGIGVEVGTIWRAPSTILAAWPRVIVEPGLK